MGEAHKLLDLVLISQVPAGREQKTQSFVKLGIRGQPAVNFASDRGLA